MKALRIALVLAILLCLGAGGFVAYAWEPALPERPAGQAAPSDPALIERGRTLAAVGNCVTCHTTPGSRPFAGGLALETPFGTIRSTNITPDPKTGIGSWSEEAFARSMRQGVDREGRHLYPAFPYDHFTLVNDDDNRALYAYLMALPPVERQTEANALPFPFNVRMLVAGWKLLFFNPGPYQPDPDQNETWNHGRYLAEGLGHCGACHTPRNLLGAERADEHWAGAELEGWNAYAINAANPAPVPWDAEALGFYLAHGFHERHGVSRGTMAPVTANLGTAPEADVQALAAYVAERMGQPSPDRQAAAKQALERARQSIAAPATAGDSQAVPAASSQAEGELVYRTACASCHEAGRPQPYGGLSFHLSTAVRSPNPQNIINVTLWGLPAAAGEASPVMPGFKGVLDERQMTALLAYFRATFAPGLPPWEDAASRVADTISGRTRVTLYRSDGSAAAPVDSTLGAVPWQ